MKKAAIWRTLRISKTTDLNIKYRNIAEQCKIEIQKFDSEREEKLLKANNLGAFYKFVNKKLSNSSGIAPLKHNGQLLINDIDKANILNSYFESVFTHDNGSLPTFPHRLQNNDHISDIKISPQIVFNIYSKSSRAMLQLAQTNFLQFSTITLPHPCHTLSPYFSEL